MYNKTSFINEKDYAEVSGTRWIMRDLPSYAEGHQLCAKLCAHNRIIQRSLLLSAGHQGRQQIHKQHRTTAAELQVSDNKDLHNRQPE